MKPARNLLNLALMHPFLIALYPVISLWLANADQVKAYALTRPLIYALVLAVLTVSVGFALFRSRQKAALFASLFLILFFTYGHIFGLIDMKSIFGVTVGRHRYMLLLWLMLFAAGIIIIAKTRANLLPVTRILNLVSLFLVGFVVIQLAYFLAVTRHETPNHTAAVQPAVASLNSSATELPDIYYIILDGYARQDVLQAQHGIDIQPVVGKLRDMGFEVMDCAQSNYTLTSFSMASSLNVNYLDALNVPLRHNDERVNYSDFTALIGHSLVREKLTARGYRFISFKALYPWMDIPDSDEYLDAEKSENLFDRQESINFQYLFLHTTAMRLVIETEERSPEMFNKLPPFIVQVLNPKANLLSSRNLKQRDQNLYEIETLRSAARLTGPKFFYAHLFITHPPYVFRPDGSLRWPVVMSQEAYDDQIRYINSQLVDVLKSIIAESKFPPIIIVQADHGYHASFDPGRVKIINAYYLPNGGAQKLYPTITPVNTFRLIFDTYFGESMPLLEDKSYFSPSNRPYQFEAVPNNCPGVTK